MRTEFLEDKLGAEFAFMRVREGGGEPYDNSGCECGDGWYNLLREMCLKITKAYADSSKPVDIRITQIKQKFGTLRVYYHINDEAMEEVVSKLVREYVDKSEHICELCGTEGKMRTTEAMLSVLCDKCLSKVKARNEPPKDMLNEDAYITGRIKIIEDYLIARGENKRVASKIAFKFYNHRDLLEELITCIEEAKYKEEGIRVGKFSAEQIHLMAPHFTSVGSYCFLITMRENPEYAKKFIKARFPIK
jgi:hypothetical protein